MIEVEIRWEKESEIDRMIRISGVIREALRDSGDFAGSGTLNGDNKTNRIDIRKKRRLRTK